MPKKPKAVRLTWSIAGLGAGVTCMVALIQGNGTLVRGNVILLGILGTLFFFTGAIGLRLHKAPFPLGVPIRLAILLFASAGLMGLVCWHVWPESIQVAEAPKLQQAQPISDRPLFRGRIEYVYAVYITKRKQTVIFVLMSIKNDGAPSAVEGWKLGIKSATLNVSGVRYLRIPAEWPVGQNGQLAVVFHDKDCLYEKAAKPTQRGEILNGWLPFAIPGDHWHEIIHGKPLVTITFMDYADHSYEASLAIQGPQIPRSLPGAEVGFVRDPNEAAKPDTTSFPSLSLEAQQGYPAALLNPGTTTDTDALLKNRRYYILTAANHTSKDLKHIDLTFQFPYPVDEAKLISSQFVSDSSFSPTDALNVSGTVQVAGRMVTGSYHLAIGRIEPDGKISILLALNSFNYQPGRPDSIPLNPATMFVAGTFERVNDDKIAFYAPLQLVDDIVQLGEPGPEPKGMRRLSGFEIVP